MTVTKKTPSLVTAIALESAINSIHLEYGRIPNIGHRMTTDSPDGIKLLNILLGSDAVSDDALNTREIKFLSVREGKNHRNGLIFAADSNSVLGLYDPWGSPYTVILNPENKEPLRFKHGSRGIELKDRRSAAFSPGPDKQIGTSDDVKTW